MQNGWHGAVAAHPPPIFDSMSTRTSVVHAKSKVSSAGMYTSLSSTLLSPSGPSMFTTVVMTSILLLEGRSGIVLDDKKPINLTSFWCCCSSTDCSNATKEKIQGEPIADGVFVVQETRVRTPMPAVAAFSFSFLLFGSAVRLWCIRILPVWSAFGVILSLRWVVPSFNMNL